MRHKEDFKIIGYAKKGTYCLRCGMKKIDIKKEKFECSIYGTYYKKHIYK